MNNDEPRSSSKRSWQEATSEVRVTLLQISQGGFIEQLVRRGRSLCRTTRGLKQSRVFFHRFLLQVSRSVCVMTTQLICKLLRSKEASAAVDVRTWPPVMDTGTSHTHTQVQLCRCVDLLKKQLIVCLFVCLFSSDDLPKKKPPLLYKPSNPDTLAYLDFSVSTTGMLAGVKVHVNSPPENQ